MPIQTTNIFNTAGDGIDFSAAPQTWTIASGVNVSSGNEFGIDSNLKFSAVINFVKYSVACERCRVLQ